MKFVSDPTTLLLPVTCVLFPGVLLLRQPLIRGIVGYRGRRPRARRCLVSLGPRRRKVTYALPMRKHHPAIHRRPGRRSSAVAGAKANGQSEAAKPSSQTAPGGALNRRESSSHRMTPILASPSSPSVRDFAASTQLNLIAWNDSNFSEWFGNTQATEVPVLPRTEQVILGARQFCHAGYHNWGITFLVRGNTGFCKLRCLYNMPDGFLALP
jgi:hypothetical protein